MDCVDRYDERGAVGADVEGVAAKRGGLLELERVGGGEAVGENCGDAGRRGISIYFEEGRGGITNPSQITTIKSNMSSLPSFN